jgi:hypothetical protein
MGLESSGDWSGRKTEALDIQLTLLERHQLAFVPVMGRQHLRIFGATFESFLLFGELQMGPRQRASLVKEVAMPSLRSR